jgi:hypothetical protein
MTTVSEYIKEAAEIGSKSNNRIVKLGYALGCISASVPDSDSVTKLAELTQIPEQMIKLAVMSKRVNPLLRALSGNIPGHLQFLEKRAKVGSKKYVKKQVKKQFKKQTPSAVQAQPYGQTTGASATETSTLPPTWSGSTTAPGQHSFSMNSAGAPAAGTPSFWKNPLVRAGSVGLALAGGIPLAKGLGQSISGLYSGYRPAGALSAREEEQAARLALQQAYLNAQHTRVLNLLRAANTAQPVIGGGLQFGT